MSKNVKNFDACLSWAYSTYPFDSYKVIKNSAWSTTVSLRRETNQAFLKIAAKPIQRITANWQLAHQLIPKSCPRTLNESYDLNCALFEDHRGTAPLDSDPKGTLKLIDIISKLLVDSRGDPKLGITTIEPVELHTKFYTFLEDPETGLGNSNSIYDYIDDVAARAFSESFLSLKAEVGIWLARASSFLPNVFNHLDLHSSNAAVDSSGKVKVHDWDDAAYGPIGLTIANTLTNYSGIVSSIDALGNFVEGKSNDPDSMLLSAWLKALELRGYSEKQVLTSNIAPSLFFGLVSSICEYQVVKPKNDDHKLQCQNHVAALANRLFLFAHAIGTTSNDAASSLAASLVKNGLEEQLSDFITRAALNLRLDPRKLCTGNIDAQKKISTIWSLCYAGIEAQLTDRCPTLQADSFLLKDEKNLERYGQKGAELFSAYGCLKIDGVIPVSVLADCYRSYQNGSLATIGRQLKVGHNRTMSTPILDGPLASDELLFPKQLWEVLKNLLGQDFILGSATLVTSAPSAKQQHMHCDHSRLFPEMQQQPNTAPYAITVLVPLFDLDEEVGGTIVVKGSHTKLGRENETIAGYAVHPKAGSALLIDYRTLHCGQGNNSKNHRPVLSLVFQRSWFRDSCNFVEQDPLVISQRSMAKKLAQHANMLKYAKVEEYGNEH